jgi:hypothetical protein
MLMKLLGGIDIISGIILLLSLLISIPSIFLWFFGIALMVKSLLGLLKDFASWIDFLSGLTILLLIAFPVPRFILIAMAFLLLQKSLFSFIGE